MRNKNFIYHLLLTGFLIFSGSSRALCQTPYFDPPNTNLKIIESYEAFIDVQKNIEDEGFKLVAAKGLPESVQHFPDSYEKYVDLIFGKAVEFNESYIGHYYQASACPGFNHTQVLPFVEINYFEYTTNFSRSNREIRSLQISAYQSWYKDGQCQILPAITSLEWER